METERSIRVINEFLGAAPVEEESQELRVSEVTASPCPGNAGSSPGLQPALHRVRLEPCGQGVREGPVPLSTERSHQGPAKAPRLGEWMPGSRLMVSFPKQGKRKNGKRRKSHLPELSRSDRCMREEKVQLVV